MDKNNQHTTDHDLLVRIDERTRAFHEKVSDQIANIHETMVTRKEFMPVKSIVYSAVSIIGVIIVTAIIGTIIK